MIVKCISLWQPWAQLVVEGHKRQETRSFKRDYRGVLYIHASKTINTTIRQISLEWPFTEYITNVDSLVRGAIIGRVTLYDIITSAAATTHMEQMEDEGTAEEYGFGDYSAGRWVWLLRDAVKFNNPIKASGQLGLWDHRLNTEQNV
jgi:hypothetical protein